ncbi:hypothetical protein LTR08_006407 [Meristemomyces frigidus]|nr:hypothetical protein LTR08_006407 [Meristemomyces frigidus]
MSQQMANTPRSAKRVEGPAGTQPTLPISKARNQLRASYAAIDNHLIVVDLENAELIEANAKLEKTEEMRVVAWNKREVTKKEEREGNLQALETVYNGKLRIQSAEHDIKLSKQNELHEAKLEAQKNELVAKLDTQKEEYEKKLLTLKDATVNALEKLKEQKNKRKAGLFSAAITRDAKVLKLAEALATPDDSLGWKAMFNSVENLQKAIAERDGRDSREQSKVEQG